MNTADYKLANFFARNTTSVWRKAALFSVAYFLCAAAGTFFSARGGIFLTFWLPAGLFLGVLLLNRTGDWPWLVLAVFPANLLFDLLYGTKLPLILVFYCVNTLQAVTGAWLVRRFVAERPRLATLKEFFALVGFAAVFSAMPCAVITAEALVYFGLSQSFEQSWKTLWGSNAMAILVLTPFILIWFSKPSEARNYFDRPNKIAEAVLLLLALVVYETFLLVWGHGITSINRVWVIPLLLWTGLRFGPRGASAVSLLLLLSLTFFTVRFSIGLTAAQVASGEYVFPMQTVLAMAGLVALIPAIVVDERERTMAKLRESEEHYRNLTQAAFEGIFISENGRLLDINDQGLKMFGYERSEMIGLRIIDLVTPEWRDSVAERIRAGQGTIMGHHLLRKDGSIFSAEAQAKMVRVGNRTLRMTALRDITDRLKAEQARAEYPMQLIASQEAERTRIARELHDGLGQNLLLIKNRVQIEIGRTTLSEDLRQELQDISNLASQAITEVRQISHGLHPHQLELLGLNRALQALIYNAGESSGIAISGKFDSVDDVFPHAAATNVYRIVQESLNNILKHSRATNARISLERDVHEVLLKIEDDGCGFQAGENAKGLGLKNITERVRMLGGKIKLDTQLEKGTQIEITIPIAAESQ